MNEFSNITIYGKFIYAYLCMETLIKHKKLSEVPPEIYDLCNEFLMSEMLDMWQSKAEEILPSYIIDVDIVKSGHYSKNTIAKIKKYYISQPQLVSDILEDLLWIGISNIYVAYNPENSLKYLRKVINALKDKSIPLPPLRVIENCTVEGSNFWGKPDNLKNYLLAAE